MTFVDLSHTISDGLVTYPGLPAPRISDHLSREASAAHYAPGTTFHIARVDMVANTGTYLDAPSHRHEGTADVADLRLEQLADLDGIVVEHGSWGGRGRPHPTIDVKNKAVLIRTGWSQHFGTPEYGSGRHPFLAKDQAQALVDGGAALVGIDSLNIDDTTDRSRSAHTILLSAGIPIVEHLTALDRLPLRGFRFFAVPVKMRGVGSFPVRAFAIL